MARRRTWTQKPEWPYEINLDSDQAQGLIRWFSCDPAGGGTLIDLIARNDGTLTSGASFVTGSGDNEGAVLQFDGSDDYVDCGDIDQIDGVSALSVSMRVRPASTGFYVFAAKTNSSANQGWFFQNDGGTGQSGPDVLLFYDGGAAASGETGSGTLAPATWQHIAFRFDGSGATSAARLRMWVNGDEKTLSFAGSIGATLTASATSLRLGRWEGSSAPFHGEMRDIRIYNTAIAPTTIAAMYDPDTRWDLCWKPGPRAFSLPAAAPTTGSQTLLGGLVHSNLVRGRLVG
jgi:hypothetical protein